MGGVEGCIFCNSRYSTTQMLGQIQIFNNLIIPVVDSLRFLSPMSYDVLACMSLCVCVCVASAET